MKFELLDRMSFGELLECLEYVLAKIDTIEAEVGKRADDPRLDRLYLAANKIVVRMNTLVQDGKTNASAENLAVWNKQIPKYEEDYQKYLDTFQDEEILIDTGD